MSKPTSLTNYVTLKLALFSGERTVNLPMGANIEEVKEVLLQQLFISEEAGTDNLQSHDELKRLSVKLLCGIEPIEISINNDGQILATIEGGRKIKNVKNSVISVTRQNIPLIAFNIAAKLERRGYTSEGGLSEEELQYLNTLNDTGIAKVLLRVKTTT